MVLSMNVRLNERSTHLIVVILVTPARLDQHIKRSSALGLISERPLLSRVLEYEIQSLLIEEFERGKNLSQLRASFRKDFLDAEEIWDAEDCDVYCLCTLSQ